MRGHDGVQWVGRDLRGLRLAGASLRGANLRGCVLDDMDLRGADLWGANVAQASLRRADLRAARIGFASFAGADLRAARLPFDRAYCDLGGAHLACADFAERRRTSAHVWAALRGYPSFADALSPLLTATSMRFGPMLVAIDAAPWVSADVDAELAALVREREPAPFAVGATAVARLRRLGSTAEALLARLEPGYAGATAVVALLRCGVAEDVIVARCPALLPELRARPEVARLLAHVAAWPDPDAPPPPVRM